MGTFRVRIETREDSETRLIAAEVYYPTTAVKPQWTSPAMFKSEEDAEQKVIAWISKGFAPIDR